MERVNTAGKRLIPLCLMAISIVLMALPYGVRVGFANPEGSPFIHHYSYFSTIPMGYANIFPIITVIATIVVTIIIVVKISKRAESGFIYGKAEFIFLGICIAASLLSWILFNAISIIGVIVFILHDAALALGIINNKQQKNNKAEA